MQMTTCLLPVGRSDQIRSMILPLSRDFMCDCMNLRSIRLIFIYFGLSAGEHGTRRELGVVMYAPNVLGARGPRKMQVGNLCALMRIILCRIVWES